MVIMNFMLFQRNARADPTFWLDCTKVMTVSEASLMHVACGMWHVTADSDFRSIG